MACGGGARAGDSPPRMESNAPESLRRRATFLLGRICKAVSLCYTDSRKRRKKEKECCTLKVFISADIEGTCGITDWAETERVPWTTTSPFRSR